MKQAGEHCAPSACPAPAAGQVPNFGELGYITFKTNYARKKNPADPADARTEDFADAVGRVIAACESQLRCGFTREEEEELRAFMMGMKCSVAGRFLWQLGTGTVERLGLLSLQNCAFVAVDEPVRPFTWAFEALMLGCGVGFSVERKHIAKLPPIRRVAIARQDTNDADFIVPDKREGWVALVQRVLEAHFLTGESFTYSCVCLRSKGEPLKTFGGVASGPKVLCDNIALINKLLNARAGERPRSVDVYDVMTLLADIVVSGNIRRSAMIALGDCDDEDYLAAKRWDLGHIPPWRSNCNNSVVCADVAALPPLFWEGYRGNGEPYGLVNLELARSCGRLGDARYPDPDVAGFNPCAEQPLANKETCCLAEIFLPNVATAEELYRCAAYLYRICKRSLLLPCHFRDTEAVVHRNMRIGIGVTGYLQASEEQKGWLPGVYERLRALDAAYSAEIGCPPSVKLTTCKPSGTLALLAGVTSGVHPGYARYMIRRNRLASNSPLVDLCKQHGYPVEYEQRFDGTLNYDRVVVSFPYEYPEGTVLAKDCSAVDQMNYVARLQRDWSDNAVSCTVYYRLEELPAIQAWLAENYASSVKSMSFLLHTGHGFAQAPFEEITEAQYRELRARTRRIYSDGGLAGIDNEELVDNAECPGGACPIR